MARTTSAALHFRAPSDHEAAAVLQVEELLARGGGAGVHGVGSVEEPERGSCSNSIGEAVVRAGGEDGESHGGGDGAAVGHGVSRDERGELSCDVAGSGVIRSRFGGHAPVGAAVRDGAGSLAVLFLSGTVVSGDDLAVEP